MKSIQPGQLCAHSRENAVMTLVAFCCSTPTIITIFCSVPLKRAGAAAAACRVQ